MTFGRNEPCLPNRSLESCIDERYCFINRSIGVPLDLRDSKIAFFMEETTNSVFITIFSFFFFFSLFFPPKLNNAPVPHLRDLQLFNEQPTKSRQNLH